MNTNERKAVAMTLERLWTKYENRYDWILKQMEKETVMTDFYEDLYDILYDFSYDEVTLLARIMKLLDQKSEYLCNKNRENRYN